MRCRASCRGPERLGIELTGVSEDLYWHIKRDVDWKVTMFGASELLV